MHPGASPPHEPRLPIYLLIDCSGTMIRLMPTVRSSVSKIVEILNYDMRSLSTAAICLIPFDDDARPTPLTALRDFRLPPLEALGKTQLGLALRALNTSLDRDLVANRRGPDGALIPGDYQPLVFLLTDGEPSQPEKEDWRAQAALLKARRVHKPLHVVALAIGRDANTAVLRQIADEVVMVTGDLAHLEQALMGYFDWIAESVVKTLDTYTTMHGTPVEYQSHQLPQFPLTLSRAPQADPKPDGDT